MTIEIHAYNLQDAERMIIEKCIAENGEKSLIQISNLLGINANTVKRKIKKLKLDYIVVHRGKFQQRKLS